MKVWIATFAILFALAELYQWAKEFISPVPIFILGGAFLAIASNYEKGICSFSQPKAGYLEQDNSLTAREINPDSSVEQNTL